MFILHGLLASSFQICFLCHSRMHPQLLFPYSTSPLVYRSPLEEDVELLPSRENFFCSSLYTFSIWLSHFHKFLFYWYPLIYFLPTLEQALDYRGYLQIGCTPKKNSQMFRRGSTQMDKKIIFQIFNVTHKHLKSYTFLHSCDVAFHVLTHSHQCVSGEI